MGILTDKELYDHPQAWPTTMGGPAAVPGTPKTATMGQQEQLSGTEEMDLAVTLTTDRNAATNDPPTHQRMQSMRLRVYDFGRTGTGKSHGERTWTCTCGEAQTYTEHSGEGQVYSRRTCDLREASCILIILAEARYLRGDLLEREGTSRRLRGSSRRCIACLNCRAWNER